MKKRYSIIIALTLMLFASALTSLLFAIRYGTLFGNPNVSGYFAGRELSALLEIIEEVYIGEYDAAEVSAAALRAAVDALGDRWSFYMTPEEYARYLEFSENQFAGIGVGVAVNEETGGIEVIYTYKGSPAEAAGILAGDVIIGIDGEKIDGYGIDDMHGLIARPIGEMVLIEVVRAGGAVESVLVEYGIVFSDPISYEMLDGDIGYIRIANFEGGAADGFISAVNGLLEQGARAFVLDVRNNAGGRANEMTRMLDFLLPEGEIFVSFYKSGHEDIITSGPDMVGIPAIVVVNSFSISAAEYFAAMLKEYGYAEIVGERTTGKSRFQITHPLPGGGALHISAGQYLTKNRVALHDAGGLVPDHSVALSDEEFKQFMSGNLDANDDPQLRLAISLLNDG